MHISQRCFNVKFSTYYFHMKTKMLTDFQIYISVPLKEANVKVFCNQRKLKVLNEEPTCFKNFNNPSCIDPFIINSSKSFEKCLTLETGMSDFNKLIITILKVKPDKLPARIIKYRYYKNFESKAMTYWIFTAIYMAICKPRHWNLGIGIGIRNGNRIGNDIANTIISSSTAPMDPKRSRMVT